MSSSTGWNIVGGTHDRLVIDDRGEHVCEARDADTAAQIVHLAGLVPFLRGRRRDCLRALRACTELNADYWRWQGHAELSRQLLERLGVEVPQ
jgi:hypothetical protein